MPLPLADVAATRSNASTHVALSLFGGLELMVDGVAVGVPDSSARVLAYVILHGGVTSRRATAGVLWPCGGDDRAAGSLRSALWRLRAVGSGVLTCDKATLRLPPQVMVDVNDMDGWADRMLSNRPTAADLIRPPVAADIQMLPGWYDDWVVFARERLRQRVLHALEAWSEHLLAAGRHGQAIDAAMAAIAMEPLRESAHRALIVAHLREHNRIEARRAFVGYARLMRTELGIDPSDDLAGLLAGC